jgi:hypothetical protein
VKRWALLLPIFLIGLFTAFHATAATKAHKDTNASSTITPIGNSQYRWIVTQLSPDTMITTFTLVSGPGLTVTGVDSVSDPAGNCMVQGRNVSCDDTLMLAPCQCQPGGSVTIILHGSGDPAGSSLSVNGMSFPVTANPGTGTTTTTQTTTQQQTTTQATTTTTTYKPPVYKKKKVVPKCKKGHKSTKAHPCHK